MRFAAILVVLLGCAHDVRVRYPSPPDEPTGTLVLLLSQPASGVSVAINGLLVVENEHTSRVVITNAPVGTEEIVMSANGADKAMHMWVGADHPTTIPLGVPDASVGLLKTILGSLISIAAYSLLH